MSLGKKEFIIADLIRKELLIGELSVEENAFLQEWLSKPENHEYYQKIIDFETLKSKEAFYSGIDTDLAFERIKQKINFTETPVIPLFDYKKIFRYAAVLVFLAGISSVFFYLNNSDDVQKKEVVVKSIERKYDHPTLVLADGTVVSLEPKKEKIVSKNGVISNVNQVLVYDANVLKGTSTGENTLIVPVGGIYAVNLSDGTKVWLNSKSSLKYPVEFSGNKRTVTLEGEAYFEVSKNAHSPFTVKTNSGKVTVLGTHFNVSAYAEDKLFAATLAEGKVQVSETNVKNNESVVLRPGQQARASNAVLNVVEVDPSVYTAWKDGKFYFENENLKSILNKMSRWYNFNVKFEQKSLEQIKFTGIVLKQEPIENLLDIISKTSNVKYKITKVNQTYEVTVSK
jgi:ferric-dicitrate binding protein FerR (iron transport regulator)